MDVDCPIDPKLFLDEWQDVICIISESIVVHKDYHNKSGIVSTVFDFIGNYRLLYFKMEMVSSRVKLKQYGQFSVFFLSPMWQGGLMFSR